MPKPKQLIILWVGLLALVLFILIIWANVDPVGYHALQGAPEVMRAR